MRIYNRAEHDVNSVLEGFKIYFSTLADYLVKMLSKAPNKHSVNTVIKCYKHMTPGDHFNLAFISEKPVLTILEATEVSKAAGLDSLSDRFLIWSKMFSQTYNSFLSIAFEKSPDTCKVSERKPLYQKVF